jgi:hypothetical protein
MLRLCLGFKITNGHTGETLGPQFGSQKKANFYFTAGTAEGVRQGHHKDQG